MKPIRKLSIDEVAKMYLATEGIGLDLTSGILHSFGGVHHGAFYHGTEAKANELSVDLNINIGLDKENHLDALGFQVTVVF